MNIQQVELLGYYMRSQSKWLALIDDYLHKFCGADIRALRLG